MNIDCHCGKIIAIVQSSMGESDKFCFDTTVILLPSPLEKKSDWSPNKLTLLTPFVVRIFNWRTRHTVLPCQILTFLPTELLL